MGDILAYAAGFLVTIIFIAAVIYVLNAIAAYKIFKKAGESGWKAWIPFLNNYTQYKFSWKTMYFWILMGVTILATFFTAKAGEGDGNTTYSVFSYITLLIVWVIQLIGNIKLAKSFGKSTFYGVVMGITGLQTILRWIIAFGKAEYIGNTTEIAETNNN